MKNLFIKLSIYVYFLFIALSFLPSDLFSDVKSVDPLDKRLKINLIGIRNGKGLETDQKVLKETLEQMGCSVTLVNLEETKWSHAHVNIFLQTLAPEKFFWAHQNWLIPNPEWYTQETHLLDAIDLILCRTKETERIFRQLNKRTYYLGFTSPDCYREEIKKDYLHFLHLAGGSRLKGTKVIQRIWHSQASFPFLTIIDFLNPCTSHSPNLQCIPYRIPELDLRQLQNQCGIHLCPSKTEGFGHYMMEAMSAGAVVITTDAPPMNEFIKDPRCLVRYVKKTPLYLATTYEVDHIELQRKIDYLISLPPEELRAIGLNNRAVYLQTQQEFYERLEELLWITSFAFENKN